jgi:hypothetical protein
MLQQIHYLLEYNYDKKYIFRMIHGGVINNLGISAEKYAFCIEILIKSFFLMYLPTQIWLGSHTCPLGQSRST